MMLGVEIIVLAMAVYRLGVAILPDPAQDESPTSPTVEIPEHRTRGGVLPTPTDDPGAPVRVIAFPGASMSAPIVPAGRNGGTWETRHLGEHVGHLVGTSWFDDPGGNIVLAGHVESASGSPGPFAHLFEAGPGDLVVLREGDREERFTVTLIEETGPGEMQYLAQDGRRRVTLVTCTEWDTESETYLGRLIVVAEPAPATAHAQQAAGTTGQ